MAHTRWRAIGYSSIRDGGKFNMNIRENGFKWDEIRIAIIGNPMGYMQNTSMYFACRLVSLDGSKGEFFASSHVGIDSLEIPADWLREGNLIQICAFSRSGNIKKPRLSTSLIITSLDGGMMEMIEHSHLSSALKEAKAIAKCREKRLHYIIQPPRIEIAKSMEYGLAKISI